MDRLQRLTDFQRILSRRAFLANAGGGFGMMALGSLLAEKGLLAAETTTPTGLHLPARAKSVIWLFMNGGPSSIDLFDHKPALDQWDGKQFPGGVETLFPNPGPIMRSPFKFKQYGESGATVSEVFPHLARHVDDITFLHACGSEAQNHVPACYMVNSGAISFGKPNIGSWITYGLGTENRDMPGFVVMCDHRGPPEGSVNLWDSGFLPGEYQGVHFRSGDNPVLYLDHPSGLSDDAQRQQLELLRRMNARHAASHPAEADLESTIQSFETAFRMQTAVPELTDISRETEATQQLYGLDVPACEAFGSQLLQARRMVESGIRFIQIYHGGFEKNWDQHAALAEDHAKLCFETDRPIAGLLSDLKQRGLLDSTLVIWGGEFGRSPTSQDRDGRDHNPFGFTMWLAGGGVKRGFRYGQTDEFGYKPVENPVSMHDLHATVLHLVGLDHEQLTFRHNGRDQTITNSLGSVVTDLLA